MGSLNSTDVLKEELTKNKDEEERDFYNKLLEYNSSYIIFLKDFIKKNNIKKIVNIGVGDWSLGNVIYDNLDLNLKLYEVINGNNKLFPDFLEIQKLDLSGDFNILESADLYIIKDIFYNWSNEHIEKFMDYVVDNKKTKYIITTNYNKEEFINEEYLSVRPRILDSSSYPLNKYGFRKEKEFLGREISLLEIEPKLYLEKKVNNIFDDESFERSNLFSKFNNQKKNIISDKERYDLFLSKNSISSPTDSIEKDELFWEDYWKEALKLKKSLSLIPSYDSSSIREFSDSDSLRISYCSEEYNHRDSLSD